MLVPARERLRYSFSRPRAGPLLRLSVPGPVSPVREVSCTERRHFKHGPHCLSLVYLKRLRPPTNRRRSTNAPLPACARRSRSVRARRSEKGASTCAARTEPLQLLAPRHGTPAPYPISLPPVISHDVVGPGDVAGIHPAMRRCHVGAHAPLLEPAPRPLRTRQVPLRRHA